MKTSVVHHSGHSTSILRLYWHFICICSVAQSCLALCDPMDCSMPGFHVHYQLPEPAQTQVHWVGDAIQPPHPLLSTSPPAFSLCQHQGLFQWVSSASGIGAPASASIFPMNIQDWFPLGLTGLISLLSKGLSISPPTGWTSYYHYFVVIF